MPDRDINLMIIFLHQNKGIFPKRRRDQFSKLTDDEIQRMQKAYRTASIVHHTLVFVYLRSCGSVDQPVHGFPCTDKSPPPQMNLKTNSYLETIYCQGIAQVACYGMVIAKG